MSIFNSIKVKRPRSTMFDLSHEVKMSCNMAQLVPFLCKEVVPGDKFQVNSEIMMRFAPMLAPIMHRINVFTHFFFVPNRLIWNEWEDFITGGPDGQTMPVFPFFYPRQTMSPTGEYDLLTNGSLVDYMGYPVAPDSPSAAKIYPTDFKFNALPFRAYSLIWNEYYRDQNLHPAIEFSLDSGMVADDTVREILTLRNRCWEKDYFTSALPWTQRGGDVNLPLSGDADIVFEPTSAWGTSARDPFSGNPITADTNVHVSNGSLLAGNVGAGGPPIAYDPQGTLKADLSSVNAVTINELRRANRLQEWLEKNARGGARYIEQILSHFGVKSSDARLQRPEFLGGGKTPVVISEVLQTSQTTNDSAQATMAGHGISVGNTHRFRRFFEEHGFVIGIMSVMPRTAYQQGVPRQYLKFDKFDYYYPEFAHLGEQPVYDQELYMDVTVPADSVFGYQSRYSEYKYTPSSVHGDFRSSLNFWHLGRVFNSRPSLNQQFVEADPETLKRIFAVSDESHKLWIEIFNNVKAIRPMPRYGTPRL